MTKYKAVTNPLTGKTERVPLPDDHPVMQREFVDVSVDAETLVADRTERVRVTFTLQRANRQAITEERTLLIAVNGERYQVALNKKGTAKLPITASEPGTIQIEVLDPPGASVLLQAVPQPQPEGEDAPLISALNL